MKSTLRLSLTVLAALSLTAAGCKKDDAKPGSAPTAGDKIVEGAKQVGQGIAEGAKGAWNSTKEGAKVVGETVVAGAKVVGESVAAGAKVVAAEASDTWITTKIKGKIGVSNLFAVSVDTNAGVVTLSGKVKTPAERDTFEKLAKETDGVKQIINNLIVDAPPPAPPAPVAPAAPAPAPAK